MKRIKNLELRIGRRDLPSTTFMFYVYIIKSKMNNQIYTGSTKDLKKRLKDHNEGKEISTKRYRPWKLIYYEAFLEENLARIREKNFKYNGNAIRELKKRIGVQNSSSLESGAGFTLIELLTVAALIVVIGVMIVAVITSSLRGSNRSNNVSEIRDRGVFILNQMSKTLTYAKSFDGVSTTGAFGSYTTNCTVSPSPQYKYIKITSFDLGQTVYACTTDNISSNSANLVNTSSMTVTQCYFTCTQTGTSATPRIDIYFTLSKNPTSTFVENRISTPFQTSVSFRNY